MFDAVLEHEELVQKAESNLVKSFEELVLEIGAQIEADSIEVSQLASRTLVKYF